MTNLVSATRPLGAFAVLLAALSTAGPASAQSDEQRASARALATEGAAAFNEGRFKDSADLFARAESLMHAPPHLLFLARSYAKTGQVVKARETYMKIVKEQLSASSPQAFRDAQASAQDELRVVEPRIAKLTIQVAGAENVKDLTVSVDGVAIPSVMIGIAQPVDPGEHKVSALATGKRAQPQSVSLKEGERSALTLKLEVDPSAVAPPAAGVAPAAVTPAAAAPPEASGANLAPPASGTPTGDQGVSSGSNGMKIAGYSALGVGVVGLGLGTVFVLKSSAKRSDADDLFKTCPSSSSGRLCSEDVKGRINDFDSQADSARTLGIVGFAVGGVGVAAGITLLVLSGNQSSASTASAAHWVPLVGPNYAGVAGTF
jgi:hypothetical protein